MITLAVSLYQQIPLAYLSDKRGKRHWYGFIYAQHALVIVSERLKVSGAGMIPKQMT